MWSYKNQDVQMTTRVIALASLCIYTWLVVDVEQLDGHLSAILVMASAMSTASLLVGNLAGRHLLFLPWLLQAVSDD